jgi:hypothetical protein
MAIEVGADAKGARIDFNAATPMFSSVYAEKTLAR